MKKIIYFSIALFWYSNTIFAQSPFWTETFGTGCNQGQYANGYNGTNGSWSVANTGTNGFYPNKWFASSTEANTGVGNCGDGCLSNPLLSNRTLHIGFDLDQLSPGFYDFGAAYIGGSGYETDSRAQSPTINCTGQSNIVLSFAYMLGGVAGSDYFEVQYSANNGTNWSIISTPPPTNNAGCSGQGLWTTYTVNLPATANNNANVKIGFRWQNVDPSGADPSVAVDDITLTSLTPQPFSPTFTLATSACVSNTLTLTANTGTYAVTGYTWSSVPAAVISSPNASATPVSFSGAGTYTISLTATSGGTTATTSNVIVISPNPTITINPSNVTCFGMCNGSATVTATGGGPIYSYSYTPSGGNTPIAFGLCAGVYTVTVTSSSTSCSSAAAFTISQPPQLSVSTSFTNGTCGACNGSITYTANGGTPPYTYSVAPGNSSNNLCAGNYTVVAFDSGSCPASGTVAITSVSLGAAAASSSASCGTCDDGSATVTVSGGTAPLTYSWLPTGGNTPVASSLTPGCYTVTVTDNMACSATSTTCVGFTTGIFDNKNEGSFEYFPNPTNGILTLTFEKPVDRTLTITDISGRILLETTINTEVEKVDLGSYNNGVYFIAINNKVFRVVKQ